MTDAGSKALKALELYDLYEAAPQDRGGKTGPKGRAWQAFLDAKAEATATVAIEGAGELSANQQGWSDTKQAVWRLIWNRYGETSAEAAKVTDLIVAIIENAPASLTASGPETTVPTEDMIEAGEEALRAYTTRFLDGAEVVENGAVEAIYRAMRDMRPAPVYPVALGSAVAALNQDATRAGYTRPFAEFVADLRVVLDAVAERNRPEPDTHMVTLAACPPGLFLTAEGHLGLKTEYGAMETVGPTNVPGSEVRWVVGREPEAYVAASGEYFWGGTSTHEKRREVLVKPIEVADLNLGVGPQDEENPWRSQAEWSALLNGRDNFIVNEGLWSAFCDYLEKTA